MTIPAVPGAEDVAYLEIHELSKTIGTRRVLSGVTFSVSRGSITSVLGPSGSGKSTLLRLVAGLERPDSGEIWCNAEAYDIHEASYRRPPYQRDLGMVFQDFGLWPHMTVMDHALFPLWSRRKRRLLTLSKEEIRRQAWRVLELFHIADLAFRRPHELSGGQQQRVAFARAVAASPGLILLDEAFSALDPQLRQSVRDDLLSVLRKRGSTVLNVTHDQDEAMAISDTVVVLHEGNVMQVGSPADLYERPAHEFVARFIGSGLLVPVRRDGESRLILPDGRRIAWSGVNDKALAHGYLVLRPEDIHLVDSPPGDWVGSVVRQTRKVGRWELLVNVPEIGLVTLFHHRAIAIGQKVHLVLAVTEVHVIPRTENLEHPSFKEGNLCRPSV